MKFTGTLAAPNLDMSGYLEALHKQLTAAIQTACREWLNATVSIIPVWSGASRATFQKLSDDVSYPLSIIPVTRKDRISLGWASGDGKLVADPKGLYWFSYSTTLKHLITNEYTHATKGNDPSVFAELIEPGPYHFQDKGVAAFNAVAAKVRLPNPVKYIKVEKIRVG